MIKIVSHVNFGMTSFFYTSSAPFPLLTLFHLFYLYHLFYLFHLYHLFPLLPLSKPYYWITRKTLWGDYPRGWRTLPPLYLTPSHIICATVLTSVHINNLVRNGNKTRISFPLRTQKVEKTSFLVRNGTKMATSFPLRHLHFQSHHSSWRS